MAGKTHQKCTLSGRHMGKLAVCQSDFELMTVQVLSCAIADKALARMEHVISHALFLGVQPKTSRITIASPCPIPHCGGSPVDMHSTNIPSGCEECVAECDVEACDLDSGNSQCTDHCLVVPCEDLCPDVCATACIPWFDAACEAGPLQGFQDFSSCCADVPSQGNSIPSLSGDLLEHRQECRVAQHADWDKTSLSRELDALTCPCSTQSQPHSFDCDTCDPRFLSIDKSSTHPRQYSSISRPSFEENPGHFHSQGSPFSPILSANASARSSPDPSSMSASTCDAQVFEQFDALEKRSIPNASSYQTQPSENFCLWAECRQSFDSFQDLISHVNATHLHLHIPPRNLSQQAFLPQPSCSPVLQFHPGNIAHPSPTSVSCMWGDCNMYPSPARIPGPSAGNVTDAALGLLASHLLQDHLGVSVSQPSSSGATRPVTHMHTSEDPQGNSPTSMLSHVPDLSRPTTQSYQSHISSVSPLSSTLNDFTQHHCKWQPCLHAHTVFNSSADLTTHITDVHVGGGKNKYNCMWEGCNRQGELGFSSKQKILRHIQSHTGHRPFRCKLCDQYFSEAATLQQHMRRHTKEKPYVCDFPGCNKAFAITGALTIHKRTHSGKKPFKCTYCDRSFSESSNLSKHIRTHTGDRPYPCSYTGCEKRFARPDQVARHMKVHNKKRNAENAEAVVEDLEEADNVEEMEIEELS